MFLGIAERGANIFPEFFLIFQSLVILKMGWVNGHKVHYNDEVEWNTVTVDKNNLELKFVEFVQQESNGGRCQSLRNLFEQYANPLTRNHRVLSRLAIHRLRFCISNLFRFSYNTTLRTLLICIRSSWSRRSVSKCIRISSSLIKTHLINVTLL